MTEEEINQAARALERKRRECCDYHNTMAAKAAKLLERFTDDHGKLPPQGRTILLMSEHSQRSAWSGQPETAEKPPEPEALRFWSYRTVVDRGIKPGGMRLIVTYQE